MGYIKENKAVIENLFSSNIKNNSSINTVYLQTGSTTVTENLTSNALTTKSIKHAVTVKALTVSSGAQVEVLTRSQVLNSAIFIYEIDISGGTQSIRLPKMTSEDVGLLIRIGKIGDTGNANNNLTIVASSGDYLNNLLAGSTVITDTNNTFRDIILTKVIGGVSYWVTQVN